MNKTFKIKSLDTHEFRIAKISPIELLALQMQINFNDLQLTTNLFTYALEHIEVNVAEMWVPVKVHDKDEYMPISLATNLVALRELVFYFLNEYMKPLFMNSNE